MRIRGKKKGTKKAAAADDMSEGGSTSKSLYSFSGLMRPTLRVKSLAAHQRLASQDAAQRITSRTPVLRKNTPLSSKERLNLSGDGIQNKPIGTGPKFSSPQANSEIRDIRLQTSQAPNAPTKPTKKQHHPLQQVPQPSKS
mmetsp:Transcript_2726/g.4274  ORF Transcript_2726/g.4274 Transcript_2726/m.4274 type:complete len:141 (-) Transcript_2726:70-492(-)